MQVIVQAEDLREDDRLDLEGDPIADRRDDPDEPSDLSYEYACILAVSQENSEYWVIETSWGGWEFPPEHLFKLILSDNFATAAADELDALRHELREPTEFEKAYAEHVASFLNLMRGL